MPAPVSADVKHTGTRCPSRSAFSKGSCSSSARQIAAAIEIARHQVFVDFDDLVEDLRVRRLHRQRSPVPGRRDEKNNRRPHAPPSLGRLSGRHSTPKRARNSVSTRSGFASRLSILFTTIRRHRPRSCANSISRSVTVSTPAFAPITTTHDSTASSTAKARPRKST